MHKPEEGRRKSAMPPPPPLAVFFLQLNEQTFLQMSKGRLCVEEALYLSRTFVRPSRLTDEERWRRWSLQLQPSSLSVLGHRR